jgi:hypothetical protein
MAMTFKPKKQQIHVPGYGVVQKEDFNEKHLAVLMKRAGDNRDAFIKQHLDVDSFGDLPLFEEDEASRKAAELQAKKDALAAAKKAAAEEQAKKDAEEAALLAQMEQEEADRKAAEKQTASGVE